MGNTCSCCRKTYAFDPNKDPEGSAAVEATAAAVASEGNHGKYKTTENKYGMPQTAEPEGGWREMAVDVEGVDPDARTSKGQKTKDWNGEAAVVPPTKAAKRGKTHAKTVSIDTTDTNFDPTLNLALAAPTDDDKGHSEQGFNNPAFDDDISSDGEPSHHNVVYLDRPKSVDVDADSLEEDDKNQKVMRSSAKITVGEAGADNPAYYDSLSETEDGVPANQTPANDPNRKNKAMAVKIATKQRRRNTSSQSSMSADSFSAAKESTTLRADVEDVDLNFSGDFPENGNKEPDLFPRKQDYSDSDSDSDFMPLPSTAIHVGAKELESPTSTQDGAFTPGHRILAPAASGVSTHITNQAISDTDSLEGENAEQERIVLPQVDAEDMSTSTSRILPGINDVPTSPSPPLEPNVPYSFGDDEEEEENLNKSNVSAQALLSTTQQSSDEEDMQNMVANRSGPTLASIMKEETEAAEREIENNGASPKKMIAIVVDSPGESPDESSEDEEETVKVGKVRTTPARKLSVSSTSSSSSSSTASPSPNRQYTELTADSPVAKTPEPLDDSDVELNFDLQTPAKDTPDNMAAYSQGHSPEGSQVRGVSEEKEVPVERVRRRVLTTVSVGADSSSDDLNLSKEALDISDVALRAQAESSGGNTPVEEDVVSPYVQARSIVPDDDKMREDFLQKYSAATAQSQTELSTRQASVSEEDIVPVTSERRRVLPPANVDADTDSSDSEKEPLRVTTLEKTPQFGPRSESLEGNPVSEEEVVPQLKEHDNADYAYSNRVMQSQEKSPKNFGPVSEQEIVPVETDRRRVPAPHVESDANSTDSEGEGLTLTSLTKPIPFKLRSQSSTDEPVSEDAIVPELKERNQTQNQRLVIQMDPSLREGMEDFDSDVDHPVIDRPVNSESSLHARSRRDSSSSSGSEEELAEVMRLDKLKRTPHRDFSPAASMEVIAEVAPTKVTPTPTDDMDVNELETAVHKSEKNILSMSVEEDEDSSVFEKVLDDLGHLESDLWKKSESPLPEDVGFVARPLPEVSSEDQIEEWYQKELSKSNTGHAKWLKAAKDANFDDYKLKDILKAHRREHRHLWLQRQAERERVLGKLQEKLSARKSPLTSDKNNNDFGASSKTKSSSGSLTKKPLLMAKSLSLKSDTADASRRDPSSSDDDSDVDADAILEKYKEFVKESDSDDSPIENYYISSEEDSASDSSENPETEIRSEDVAALKQTLTHDINDNLPMMTADDFKQLMELYRKERRGLRQMREGERDRLEKSLWARLEAQRLATVRSESEKLEQSGVNGTSDILERSTRTRATTDAGSQMSQTTEMGAASNGIGQTDAATDMRNTLIGMDEVIQESKNLKTITEDEMKRRDKKFLEKVAKAQAGSDMTELMAAHLDARRQLQKKRDESLAKCQERLAAKLAAREDTADQDDGLTASHSETLLMTSKDDQLQSDLRQLDQDLLDKVEAEADDIDAAAVKELLASHQRQENELLEKRHQEKLRMKEKMEEKLRQRQKREERKADEEEVSLNEQLEKLDGDFYQVMYNKRQEGKVTDQEVTKMVADHLKRVEDFMTKLNLKVPAKRKSTKKKRSEATADPSKVSDLVEKEQQQREQVRKMRRKEREELESKMKQKLRQKKQPKVYVETPELPPPKRPPHGKKQKVKPSPEDRMDYENVEIFEV